MGGGPGSGVGGWVGGVGGVGGGGRSSSTALLVTENCGQPVRAGTAVRVARPLRAAGALGLAARPAGGGQLALTSVPPRRAAAAAGGGGAIQ